MMHDLNPKNLNINGLFFLLNTKDPIFGVFFWYYPQNEIFSQKSSPVGFLKANIFMTYYVFHSDL